MSLTEELRAVPSGGGPRCRVCIWLADMPPAEQAEWQQAFADRSFTTLRLLTVALAHGLRQSEEGVVYNHRTKHL